MEKSKEKKNWFVEKVSNIDKKLRYESSSRFIAEVSMIISTSVLINLLYGETNEAADVASYFIAIILF